MSAALPGLDTPVVGLDLDVATWGIDPSTRRVALSSLAPGGGVRVEHVNLPVPDGKGDLTFGRRARLRVLPWIAERFERDQPAVIGVEVPFASGNAVFPITYFALAALLDALGDAGEPLLLPFGPSEWKSRALGKGAGFAKKAAILRWAQASGYEGDCPKCHGHGEECTRPDEAHDHADSLGVAAAAARVWATKGFTVT